MHLMHYRRVSHFVEATHLQGENLRELRIHPIGDGRGHCEAIFCDELTANLLEEDECTAALKFLKAIEIASLGEDSQYGEWTHDFCDAHVDDVILANVVDGIGSVCVRALVVPQLDCVQDESSDFLEVTHAVCIFGQHRRAPGHCTI